MEISGDYNVYWTINPVDRSLLARSANKVRHHMETTTGDHEIIQRRWLPLDLDYSRLGCRDYARGRYRRSVNARPTASARYTAA